jgi:hypothetical protein
MIAQSRESSSRTKKVIVSTTVNHPTEAIEKFDAMRDWTLVVIGDRKTPKDFSLRRGIYVPPSEQERYHRALSDLIGWDSISRRNFGFLWARDMGADVIATVDDDNIPLDHWGEEILVGQEVLVDSYDTDAPCFDPLSVTNYPHLWHRGFPLQFLGSRRSGSSVRKRLHVDIQADLWDGDPDIDALCRLEHSPRCSFDEGVFPFTSVRTSPFNSQNTFLSRKVLSHYFMVPNVGRMDDIWASYHLQSLGYRVIYCRPSVIQERKPSRS